jgi:hypothetical protein
MHEKTREEKKTDFLYSYLMFHPTYGANIAKNVRESTSKGILDLEDRKDLARDNKVQSLLKKMCEEKKIEMIEEEDIKRIISIKKGKRGPIGNYYKINPNHLKLSTGETIPKEYIKLLRELPPEEEKCIEFIGKHPSPYECLFSVSSEIYNFLQWDISKVKIVEIEKIVADLIKEIKNENTSEKDFRNKLADLFYRVGDLISDFGLMVFACFSLPQMKIYMNYFYLINMILIGDLRICSAFDNARKLIEEKECHMENLEIVGLLKEDSVQKLIRMYPKDVKKWLEIVSLLLGMMTQIMEKVLNELAKNGFLRLEGLIDSIYRYGEKEAKIFPDEIERYFIDISQKIINDYALSPQCLSIFTEIVKKL